MPVTIQPTTLKYKDQNGTWHQADCLKGEQGPQGPVGETGATGPTGSTGATPAFTIGTVTDVPYGTPSSATITGTAAAPVLNLQLQHGQSGNETIDDTKGNGDTDFVWSASKTYNEVNGLKSALSEIYIHKEYENTAGNGGQVTFAFTGKAGQTLRIVNGAGPVNVQTRATQSGSTVQEIYLSINQTKELAITTDFEYLHLYYSGNSITDFYIVETALTQTMDTVSAIMSNYIKNSYYVGQKSDLSDFDNAPNNSVGIVFFPLSTTAANLPDHYPDTSVIQGYGLLITFEGVGVYSGAKVQLYISIASGRKYSRNYSNGWQSWVKNIDTSLSLPNFCADAKATGDAISVVNGSIQTKINTTIDGIGFINKTNLVPSLNTGKYAIAWNVGDTPTEGTNETYAYGIADVGGLSNVTVNLTAISNSYSFFTDATRKKIVGIADQQVGTSRVYTVPSNAKYMYISANGQWGTYGLVVLSGTDDISTNMVSVQEFPYNTPVYFADNLKMQNGNTLAEIIGVSAGRIIHVEKDGSGDYTKLVDAINEAVRYEGSTVYVGAGTWDIIDELGSAYMAAVSSSSSTWGLVLKNGVHVIGTSKTLITAKYTLHEGDTGYNSNVKTYFSAFNAGVKGFTLENVTIETDNVRYTVHDDLGNAGSTPFTNRYINCKMKHTNGMYTLCIGGGLGVNGTYEIVGCIFEGDQNATGLAYYHGNNASGETTAQCKVTLKDSYFKNVGTFGMTKYGDSPLMSTAYLSNNSFGSEPYVNSGSYAPYNNVEIVGWNNEVRSAQ